MLGSLLDPIFSPLLKLPIAFAVAIIAFIVSVLVTVIYKYTTNQSLMRDLRNELKEFQKEIKELRNHPEKALEVQKKSMETNMKYMGHSMKSTLFTLLPVILIFGWLNANLAYEPILPGQEFTVTVEVSRGIETVSLIIPEGLSAEGNLTKIISDSKAVWVLKGDEGSYMLEFEADSTTVSKEVLITEEQAYSQPIKKTRGKIREITISNKPMKVLNLLGWKIGWLGTYIIFSIIFSMIIRKGMKVY
ncbi:TMCO1/EMC3 family protein [Candidatus Woesearchaeota archaeon]|nr:TMCO1/EMC3 family protein [Candidatus Woesearchaeota archaeon]